MVRLNRENRSRFYRVKCPDCENEQVITAEILSEIE
jgi:small subunit ribosomal protein S27e